jgi:hypothetical protein
MKKSDASTIRRIIIGIAFSSFILTLLVLGTSGDILATILEVILGTIFAISLIVEIITWVSRRGNNDND